VSDQLVCPACDERIATAPAGRRRGVKCPVCGARVREPDPDYDPAEDDEPEAKAETKPAGAKGSTKSRRDDDDDDDFDDDPPPRPVPVAGNLLGVGCAVVMCLGIVIAIGAAVWNARPGANVPKPVGGPQPNAPAGGGDPLALPAPPFEVDPALRSPARPVYLADMTEYGTVAGPWPFTKGNLGNPARDPIKLKGVVARKGLSMHPSDLQTTRAAYALGGKAAELTGSVGLNDQPGEALAPVVFTVVGDRKELWRSGPIERFTGPEAFRVDVRGVKVLELRATAQGSHIGAHAVWADPKVEN
jgi:hypothetical protein